MPIKTGLLIAGLGLLFIGRAGVSEADPVTVQCPETLSTTEKAEAVGHWQVYISSVTHSFSRVKIYSGQPQGKIVLDPDNADEQAWDYRWTLGDAGNDIWVECSYHSSAARLTQQLPKGLHSCESEKAGTSLTLRCE